ncbi:hypothetical protein [Helicobacter cetorum]|uniref:Uncharacterized protein n=1 Tax=Helicobacter cetorum (strain ATCC BAA-429 / MIT 00-7128) TaxID=182217 RepID=I0EP62_HELC0|nr:hypothetical protein [Helicobacter cetorum]AFI04731.1 hypothetical protein HCW_07365 [Helicobacter cetorum MIT 00-7128]
MKKEFELLNNRNCIEHLQFLSKHHLNFNLLCEKDKIHFSPKLPEEIYKKFGNFVLFVLAGYTLESLMIHKESVQFEAGFGHDNIGSIVQVNIKGIIQIIVKDRVSTDNVPLFSRFDANRLFIDQEEQELLNSKEALFSNSKNRAILENLHNPL